jgi:hypothetical protein
MSSNFNSRLCGPLSLPSPNPRVRTVDPGSLALLTALVSNGATPARLLRGTVPINNKGASCHNIMPWLMICSINTCRYVCIKHDARPSGLPFGHGRLFIYYDSIPRPGKLLIDRESHAQICPCYPLRIPLARFGSHCYRLPSPSSPKTPQATVIHNGQALPLSPRVVEASLWRVSSA